MKCKCIEKKKKSWKRWNFESYGNNLWIWKIKMNSREDVLDAPAYSSQGFIFNVEWLDSSSVVQFLNDWMELVKWNEWNEKKNKPAKHDQKIEKNTKQKYPTAVDTL